MSDFVNRLLGRTDAAPVRPLVPSRFEPATSLARDEPLPLSPEVAVSPPRPPVVPSLAGPVELETEPTAPRPESADRGEPPVRVEYVEVPAAPDPVAPQPVPAPVATTPEAPAHRPVPFDAPRAPTVPARSSAVRRLAAASAPAVPKPPAVPVAPARPARVDPLPQPDVPVPARAADPVDTPAQPAVPTASAEPETPAAPVGTATPTRAHPVGPPAASTWLPPKATAAKPDPEPVVHITIGRVEVKAAAEPTPSSRRAPHRRAALGLDEYLRRKAGDR